MKFNLPWLAHGGPTRESRTPGWRTDAKPPVPTGCYNDRVPVEVCSPVYKSQPQSHSAALAAIATVNSFRLQLCCVLTFALQVNNKRFHLLWVLSGLVFHHMASHATWYRVTETETAEKKGQR